MHLYMRKNNAGSDMLHHRPDAARKELYTLKKTLEEGEKKLTALEAQRKTLLVLSSLTKEKKLCEMAERIAAAKREYEEALAALASREDGRYEVLSILRRGTRQ